MSAKAYTIVYNNEYGKRIILNADEDVLIQPSSEGLLTITTNKKRVMSEDEWQSANDGYLSKFIDVPRYKYETSKKEVISKGNWIRYEIEYEDENESS